MKRLVSLAAAALLMASTAFQAKAIEDPDPVGSITASAYVGFVPGVGVSVTGDYVLINGWWKGHFTVGGYIGFYSDKDTESTTVVGVTDKRTFTENNFAIMPRATYGLNITDSFEVHAGTMMGFGFNGTKAKSSGSAGDYEISESNKSNSFAFQYAEVVGCRYFFTDQLGVSAEVGYGSVSHINLGVSYRF